MFMCFTKGSSVINSIYSAQQLFSYILFSGLCKHRLRVFVFVTLVAKVWSILKAGRFLSYQTRPELSSCDKHSSLLVLLRILPFGILVRFINGKRWSVEACDIVKLFTWWQLLCHCNKTFFSLSLTLRQNKPERLSAGESHFCDLVH